MKYRKRPVIIEATQWFKNGDHPDDACKTIASSNGPPLQSEGHVVRYYRHPNDLASRLCQHCNLRMHEHGWIDTLEGGHIVCPGDFVITGVQNERYPCKPTIFAATYEAVEPSE